MSPVKQAIVKAEAVWEAEVCEERGGEESNMFMCVESRFYAMVKAVLY